MLANARQELAEAALAVRYRHAIDLLDQQDWQAADDELAALAHVHTDYRQTTALLATARRHLQPPTGPSTPTVRAPSHDIATGDDGSAHQGAVDPTVFVPEPRVLDAGQPVWSVAISPDGSRLAAGSRRRVHVWDLRTGAQLWQAKVGGWPGRVRGVAFSSDGSRLATASDDKTARVWDATTGSQLLQVQHTKAVWGVAFSPDGSRLATASFDKTARVWDAATGSQLFQVQHTKAVWGVAFSPDGSRLATASVDKTARVWDAATGSQLLQVQHTKAVWGVAFSPDGGRLGTASFDETARVWDATSTPT
jgi:WD40 repeat protein